MKKIVSIVLCANILLAACYTRKATESPNVRVNHLSASEKTEGWRMLFDGHNLNGWHVYGNPRSQGAWRVGDGVIFVDMDARKKSGGGDLVTNEEFDNFDFKYEWKISKQGNSGLIFYVHEDTLKYKTTYNSGLEMQILDNEGHPDGKIMKHRAGDLYDLLKVTRETVKPVGEWNQAEIISDHGDLRFFLNGEAVLHTKIWDDNWKKLVAGSKFRNMPGFGTFTKGRLALQDHGDEVWFRNIKVRQL